MTTRRRARESAGTTLETCLAAVLDRPDAARSEAAYAEARVLARDRAAIPELVRIAAGSRVDVRVDAASHLLVGVLDEARMSLENGRAEGAEILAAARETLEVLDGRDALGLSARLRISQIYARAGCEPPRAAQLRLDAPMAPGASRAVDPGALVDGVLEEARAASDGDAHQAQQALEEMFAAVPEDMRAFLVAQVCARPDSFSQDLGVLFSLSPREETRIAAAIGLAAAARGDGLTPRVAALLPTVRHWVASTGARALLDQAISVGLRGGAFNPGSRPKWTIGVAYATLPDGSGSQSVAVTLRNAKSHAVALVLIKRERGVKDAFVVPTSGDDESRALLEVMTASVGALQVDPGYARDAIARALGEVLPPAPGLAHVVEALGLPGPLPSRPDARTVLHEIGAERALAAASARVRASLERQHEDWPVLFPVVETWFLDDDQAARAMMKGGVDPLLQLLETRREWWARQFAICAATLQKAHGAGAEAWLSFAKHACDLVAGVPCAEIAPMRAIASASRAAARETTRGAAQSARSTGAPAELDGLLKRARLSEDWLMGFLAARAVAPFGASEEWLQDLLGRIRFETMAEVERFLLLVSRRVEEVEEVFADEAETRRRLSGLAGARAVSWARGFIAHVDRVRSAWPASELAASDQMTIEQLRRAARRGTGVKDWLCAAAPWLRRRLEARRPQ